MRLWVKWSGGIPHTRRTECAKIKISQSDFSNLKFGKKVNISRDWILILAEYKNGKKMQNFQIVFDRRRIATVFLFQGVRYERSKILLHLILFNWMAIASLKKLTCGLFCLRSLAHKFFRPFGPSRMRIAPKRSAVCFFRQPRIHTRQ